MLGEQVGYNYFQHDWGMRWNPHERLISQFVQWKTWPVFHATYWRATTLSSKSFHTPTPSFQYNIHSNVKISNKGNIFQSFLKPIIWCWKVKTDIPESFWKEFLAKSFINPWTISSQEKWTRVKHEFAMHKDFVSFIRVCKSKTFFITNILPQRSLQGLCHVIKHW